MSFLWFLSLVVNWETSGNVTLGEIHVLQTKATLIIFSFSGSFSKYKEQQVFHHLWDRFLRGLTNFQVSMALPWPALLWLSLTPAAGLASQGLVWELARVLLLSLTCQDNNILCSPEGIPS